MVRDTAAIRTHVFVLFLAFVKLELMWSQQLISNWYEVQKNLFKNVVREYIFENITSGGMAQAT